MKKTLFFLMVAGLTIYVIVEIVKSINIIMSLI